MIKLNIHEAKTHLSRYLLKLEQGESILLCKRNMPIAEIRPLRKTRSDPRPVGLWRGQVEVPEEFFEPLPEDVIAGFESRAPRK